MFGALVEKLAAAIPGQWERVFATVILAGVGLLASHFWARHLARGEMSPEKRRIHLVWARNVIWFVIFLIIVSAWASTIAGFALSLAAVTGALLIVSKELVMCIHGYLYVTVVRPFKVGDLIHFNGLHGRVIDIDVFATTLVTLDDVNQPTDRSDCRVSERVAADDTPDKCVAGWRFFPARDPHTDSRSVCPRLGTGRGRRDRGSRARHGIMARGGNRALPQGVQRTLHRVSVRQDQGSVGLLRSGSPRSGGAPRVPEQGALEGRATGLQGHVAKPCRVAAVIIWIGLLLATDQPAPGNWNLQPKVPVITDWK